MSPGRAFELYLYTAVDSRPGLGGNGAVQVENGAA